MGSRAHSWSVTQVARKLLGILLGKIGHHVTQWAFRLYRPPESPEEERLVPWLRVRGDQTLRQEYDLDESSVVFDIGGYEGQWTSDIFSRYRCTVHVFEPVEEFASRIEQRFARNDRIVVHRFGLGNLTTRARLFENGDASSAYRETSQSIDVQIVRATEFLRESRIGVVHLMKINIEGGEYDLLDDLIESGHIRMVENIQVQFHDFVPDAVQRMQEIQRSLAKTHCLTYQFPFVWENWRRENDLGVEAAEVARRCAAPGANAGSALPLT